MKTFLLFTTRVHNVPGKITDFILINPTTISWIMPEGQETRIGLVGGAIMSVMEDFQYMQRVFKFPVKEKPASKPKKRVAKKVTKPNPKRKGKKK